MKVREKHTVSLTDINVMDSKEVGVVIDLLLCYLDKEDQEGLLMSLIKKNGMPFKMTKSQETTWTDKENTVQKIKAFRAVTNCSLSFAKDTINLYKRKDFESLPLSNLQRFEFWEKMKEL